MANHVLRFAAALAAFGAWIAACSGTFEAAALPDAAPPGPDQDSPDVPATVDASHRTTEDASERPDARDAARVCPLGAPFQAVVRVEHASSGSEADGLADASPAALVPVPGKSEAWVVVDRGPAPDAGQRLVRMIGAPGSVGDGGLRYLGGASVPPFEAGAFAGVTFTPQGTAVLGLDGTIVRSLAGTPDYGAPVRIVLPTPLTELPSFPFVTADGRTLFFTQDHRIYTSDLSTGNVDAPPSPQELKLSFGSTQLVATSTFETAYWVNNRDELVGGVIREGTLSSVATTIREIEAAAPGLKYPTWVSDDGCLLFFVQIPEAGPKVLWLARKG